MNQPTLIRLSTHRLDLIAATLDHVGAELESPERLAVLLNTRVEPGWPPGEYDRDAQAFFRDRLKEGGPAVVGWYGWYAVGREGPSEPSALIGAGGYFGPPGEDGVVEIGFSIMPTRQKNGYATELAKGLVQNAFTDSRVKKVIAHATPLNSASCRVLEKCGFKYVAEDEKSGNRLYEMVRDVSAPDKTTRHPNARQK